MLIHYNIYVIQTEKIQVFFRIRLKNLYYVSKTILKAINSK